jgi:hypothetical protein
MFNCFDEVSDIGANHPATHSHNADEHHDRCGSRTNEKTTINSGLKSRDHCHQCHANCDADPPSDRNEMVTSECHQRLRKSERNDEDSAARGEETKTPGAHGEIVEQDLSNCWSEEKCPQSAQDGNPDNKCQQFLKPSTKFIVLSGAGKSSQFRQ